MQLLGADGGVVGVDASNSTESLRYSSFQNFGFFNRSTWDATNKMTAQVGVKLIITEGPGSDPADPSKNMTLSQFDKNIQFYQPFVLNAIDPSRMLIGTNQLYESLNKGDSLNNLWLSHATRHGQMCRGTRRRPLRPAHRLWRQPRWCRHARCVLCRCRRYDLSPGNCRWIANEVG
jgi:hypothetical protein